MAKDLTKAQIERLELYDIRYPWNPQDILRLLDEQQAAYDGLYKEWRVKNEACNEAYAITIPRQEKRIAELENQLEWLKKSYDSVYDAWVDTQGKAEKRIAELEAQLARLNFGSMGPDESDPFDSPGPVKMGPTEEEIEASERKR